MRRLTYISALLFWTFFGYSQVSMDATVTITANTTVTSSHNLSITGNLINNGSLGLSANLANSGNYNGSGELVLNGVNQSVDLSDTLAFFTVQGGGIKDLASTVWVTGTLDLTEGILTSAAELNLIGGSIINASDSSYINGKLVRSGATTLDFPIGNTSQYLPVTLSSISGTDPVAGLELVEGAPAGTAGNSLLDLSQQRYWILSDESGTFEGAIVTLPVRNETVAPSISELTVAGGSIGGSFSGLGLGSSTGDLTFGSVTALNPVEESTLTLGRFFDEQFRVSDSMALTSIYQATAGTDWVNNTGWLTENLDNWYGLTLENKRPVSIDLSSNALAGSFPEITSGLDSVRALQLDSNNLVSLPDLTGLPSLNTLSVKNNLLGFGPLEQNLGINTFTYAPQDSLLDYVETIEEIGTVYQMNRIVSGSSNSYSWIKENPDGGQEPVAETSGSFGLSVSDFAQDGKYYASATSGVVPGLTLYMRPIFLKVASLERDSVSLMALYNATGGSSWNAGSDWTTNPITSWEEITITNQRVVGLTLPSNNLSGIIPAALEDVQALQIVDISGNNISDLPDFTQLPDLTSLDVSDNNLEFDDLEKNISLPGLTYSPQKEFGAGLNESIPKGTSYLLADTAGGSQNIYQWNLTDIQGITSPVGNGTEYLIDSIDYNTMGTYFVEVTNPLVPGLTLKSVDKNLLATASVRFTALDKENAEVTEGVGNMLKVVEGQPYDSAATTIGTADGFVFGDLVLGNYVAAIEGPEGFIPTFYESTDLWAEASVIEIRENFDEVIYLLEDPGPNGPALGEANVQGVIEAEFVDESSGRVLARRKVKKAGCSLRRRTRSGGGRTDQEEYIYELYAYVESNDQGEFEFDKIETGFYRINIEYPGVPMDSSSFVEFEITEDDASFILEAYISEEGVEVTRTNKLGFPVRFFKNLRVYPVPADDQLTVTYDQVIIDYLSVNLINLQGQSVYNETIRRGSGNQMKLNISELSSGIYMLVFSDEMGRQTLSYKIVVSHK